MKNVLVSILAFGALLSSAYSSTGAWSAYMIDSGRNEVKKVGVLTFNDKNTAQLVNFDNFKVDCSVADGRGVMLVNPILEADLILHCKDSDGERQTIAIENVKANKMHGILIEDIGNPIYFVKETE